MREPRDVNYLWPLVFVLAALGVAGKLDEPPEGWGVETDPAKPSDIGQPLGSSVALLCRKHSVGLSIDGSVRRGLNQLIVQSINPPPALDESQPPMVLLECAIAKH